MSATKLLLDKYRQTCLPQNDNGMAKRLRVSRAAVSRWATGKGHPNPEAVEQMAKDLGEPTGPWLAQIEAERARTPSDKRVWLRLAATLGTTLAIAVIALPSHAEGAATEASNAAYCVKFWLAIIGRWLHGHGTRRPSTQICTA